MSDDYYEATVLTVSQANEAVQNNPEWVELPNLEHLTPEVAAVLARSTGLLQLDGLRELPADVAEALSNRSSDDLNLSLVLDGLTELSADAAQALAPHEGRISLSGLPNISLAVASSLAESEWDRGLTLNGLTTITPDIAAALAKCRGPLCLDGITQLTPDSARALTQREAPLSLKGLTSLTTEVATALAAWVERTGDCLELSGLAEAPAEALKTLRSQPNIYLPDTLGDASDSDTDDCARCPECGKPLRSSKAQQCFECGANWRSTSSSNIAATTGKADAVRAVSEQFKDRTKTVIEGVMAHLREDNAKEILGPGLSPLIGRGSLKSIVTFALYADILRMVRDMVMADGEISDEEVQESLGLLSVLAAGFAKVRKEYAAYTQLTPDTARQFLSQYESDAGLFGHANEATKWAGVNVCRNVEAKCGDSGPVNAFCGTLVSWAESVASADGMSPEEQQHLNAFRQMFASARDASHNPTPPNDAGPSNPENLLTATSIESDPHASKSHFTHIEDGAAALLADASYPLTLSSLVALSPYAAACLGKHVGGTLELNGLREISDGVAEGLSTRTKTLSLNGLVRLSDASAMHLSRCAAKLSLRGLTELPDTPGHLALATKLASQQGDLVLDGLERLGPKVAAKLSEHSGRLALRGLTRIDDEVLSALFSRSIQPELSADMLRTLFVRGSERFIAQYCIANGGDLGILQSLSPSECDLSAARAIVDAGIDLSFDEIHEIAPDIGSVLATSTHDIRIGHLATLSEESARALREHSGTLIIGTVSEVSLGAAKALAEHCGPITVEDIDDLPEDVAAVLGQRSESGDSEQPLVERACELLSTVQGLATYDPADLRDVDFTLLATMAGELIQKLRDAEHVHRPAVESTCGVLERLQELADQDLADFDDVDLQQLANDAEAATRELNQGGSNESEDGVTEDKILTRDEAERFVADPESVNLSEYASLKDDAAAILASSREDLCLDGLKEISATAAQALIPHTGAMSLQSLETLTPSAAQCLSRHAGPLRELNLGAFVDEPLVFAALRKHVSLVAQVVQDDLMAQILRTKDIDKEDEYEFEFADASSRDLCDEEYYGNPMDDGLRLLARAEGRPVWSVPLASVKDSWVCENAGAYTLYFIGERDDVLKRLETLPNRVATAEVVQDFLQQVKAGTWDYGFLDSYGAVDVDAAAMLAIDYEWGDGNELWLNGLRSLPPEVAAALSQPQPQDEEQDKTPILVFSGLHSVSEDTASALSKRKWCLQLPNLKTLNAETATHLGAIPYLIIGVQVLSGEVAEKLATAKELTVSVPRLSEDAAVGLSAATGMLCVDVKEKPSEKTVSALKACRGTLFLQGDGAPS